MAAMAPGRRILSVAAWSALALERSECTVAAMAESLSGIRSEPRDRKGGGTPTRRSRRLASCETVEITGGYGYSPGFYTEGSSRNGAGLFVSSDGSSELFYSDREEDRRRRRRLPEDLSVDIVEDEEEEEQDRRGEGRGGRGADATLHRNLGECSKGFWSLAPVGGGYPRLTVGDCAQHPADIRVTTWLEMDCANCAEQTYNGARPEVSCFYGEVPTDDDDDDDDDGAGVGDDDGAVVGDDDGAVVGDDAVADSPSSTDSSTGISTESSTDSSIDSSTGSSVDSSVDSSADSSAGTLSPVDASACRVLDVGGRYPGLYTATGTYNNRGDFYSDNQSHNVFFMLDSPATDDGSTSSSDTERRRLLVDALFRERSEGSSNKRRLASCDNGYWIKTPTGGGYPFFAVADCAAKPQDISSSASWLIVGCDDCDPTPADSAQDIACATGEDALFATPAPVPPFEYGPRLETTLPGAGPSTCEAVSITGEREGGYTVIGEFNSRADLRSDDGLYRMYYTGAAPALEAEGWRTRRLSAEGDGKGALSAGVPRSRGLASCEGFWYIALLANKYPVFAVADCAVHPADITSTEWLYIECEDCEVLTVSTMPEASCTGAPDNVKRGGSWFSPAPTVVDLTATPAPGGVSSVSSTCTDLVVTGDFPGNYTANGTYRGKMDFFNDDQTVNLYFELAVSRRALVAGEGEGGELRGGRSLSGEVMASALQEAFGATQSLAVCTSGYWILAPVGGDGYPVFGVPDCAEHPADIRANTWLVASCGSCGVQDAPSFVEPSIACADDEGTVAGGGSGEGGVTPAPASAANCANVYGTGPAGGVYKQGGTQGGRGDFFSGNRVWNLYWAFYPGKPENRKRFRRGLTVSGGVSSEEDGVPLSEEHALALQTLAADLQRDGNDPSVELDTTTPIELQLQLQPEEVDESGRRLEFCDDGFWLVTPRGGGFPFYGTQNCANHPADMSQKAAWSIVECDGCGSHAINETMYFSCDGDGYTPPPSPTAEENAIEDSETLSPASVGSNGAAARGAWREGFFLATMVGPVVAAMVAMAGGLVV